MAHMQRPGRVGRDKFHQQALPAWALGAKLSALRQHIGHHGLLSRGFEPDIDKPRPGDVQGVHPAPERLGKQQLGSQRLGQLARAGLERFGQLHGSRCGQVAMGDHLG